MVMCRGLGHKLRKKLASASLLFWLEAAPLPRKSSLYISHLPLFREEIHKGIKKKVTNKEDVKQTNKKKQKGFHQPVIIMYLISSILKPCSIQRNET